MTLVTVQVSGTITEQCKKELNEISQDRDSETRTIYHCRIKKKKRFSLKFPEGYTDCDTPEEVRRTQRSKNIVIRTTKMRT